MSAVAFSDPAGDDGDMTNQPSPTTQDVISFAERLARADGATTLEVLDLQRDRGAWSSLTRIARGILDAFAEVGITPTDVNDLTDAQLRACVDCAVSFQDDSAASVLEGARFAVEAFLEGDLDEVDA